MTGEIAFIPGQLVEIEESDVQRDASDGRTKPRWSMPADELRETYDKIRAYRAEKRAAKEAKDSTEEREAAAAAKTTVLVPRTELEKPETAPGAAGTLAKRLLHHGWTVRAWTSRCAVSEVLYVDDSEEGAKDPHVAGDVRYEAHELETVVIVGVKRASGHMLALDATWERKLRDGKPPASSFLAARTYDPYLALQWRTSVKKERDQRAWEVQERIPGTPGLEQWLDMVAPKPPTPPKTRKTKATPSPEQETNP